MRRMFALCLALALLTSCGAGAPLGPPPTVAPDTPASGDLMQGIAGRTPAVDGALTDEGVDKLADFGVRLLQSCPERGSALVSPLSVMEALAMTANGASGRTLEQMERAFGFDSVGELNECLYLYASGLADGEGGSVHMANGIWLNETAGFRPEQAFLQTNADYYGAAIRRQVFDPSLAAEINGWVADNTAGRIDRIVDEVPDSAMAYLVNALSFDGEWETIYREDQVRPGTFTAADGTEQDAQFMYSSELGYLRDEHASGFVKYYRDRDYAFAALLPDEGVALEDYASSLTGERLRQLLAQADGSIFVQTAIPQFSASYGADLAETLGTMGMTDAFDPSGADFSRMGTCDAGRLYISRVLHKTFINVDAKGTQAGAATAVEVMEGSAMGPEETVYLNRPFLYMIVDCRSDVPIFIGTVSQLG